jgi:Tfp pilus assembly protein PilV
MVELLVAIVLLAVGLLAMGGLAVTASRQVRGGATQTVAAAVAQSRFDLLASMQCSAIANKPVVVGSQTTRAVREKWVITDGNDVVYVADTLRIPGRTRPLVYLSVIPCRD